MRALLNFLKALTGARRGLPLHRAANETQMADWLRQAALLQLKKLPDRAGRLPFKRTMESYRVDDPLPLPDRSDLRQALKTALVDAAAAGAMLLLEGPSGCGKSSLLQKGLLDDLPRPYEHAIVAVFRPEQLLGRDEKTPFHALLAHIADALDAAGMTQLAALRRPASAAAPKMATDASAALGKALERANRTLVLGVDQFEELVDLAVPEERQRGTPGGWWQVLRLLGAVAGLRQVAVAGTLESQRQTALRGMDLQALAGLVMRRENVDFPIGGVRGFVRATAAGAGLTLAPSLVDAIYQMVEDFERSRARTLGEHVSASFLPLLSLWMHRLFMLFQDRMSGHGDGVSRRFQEGSRELDEGDLEERGVTLAMAPLIGELVQAAWEEGGEFVRQRTGQQSLRVTDADAVNQALAQLERREAWAMVFVQRNGRDYRALLHAAIERGVPVPGTDLVAQEVDVPDPVRMDNFFFGLVAVDHSGNLRLLDRPRSTLSVARLITAFERRRLLVPAGPNRVRLVHQAVIDHWAPARGWVNKRQAQFERHRRLNHVARTLTGGFQSVSEVLAAGGADLLRDAVRVLRAKREAWPSMQALSESERMLRQTCLELMAGAADGTLVVEDDDGAQTSPIHEAARYGLTEPLDRWLAAAPERANWKLGPLEISPLHVAVWSAPESVKLLLKHHVRISEPDKEGVHPMAMAIFTGRSDIVALLIHAYRDGRAVAGPNGQSLIHIAAQSPREEILTSLLQDVARPLPLNDAGHSPLHFAAAAGLPGHVRLLLPLCDACGRDHDGWMPIHLAVDGNHAEAIAAILEHVDLSAADRETMLIGTSVASPPWVSPLRLAASRAQPAAVAALLTHVDPSDHRHHENGHHPIVLVVVHNARAAGGAPLADRVSQCVALLLDDGRLSAQDAESARSRAERFPDARRLIDEWLVQNGHLEGLSPDRLIDWLVGPRLEAALAVLRKAPRILDAVDSQGRSAAIRLLGQGQPQTLAKALELGIEPAANAELFRLEAAFVLHARGHPPPDPTAGAPHALVQQLATPQAAHRVLARMLPSRSTAWTVLHRLAMTGDRDTYAAVLSGLQGPLPLDMFERKPSQLAMPHERAAFEALEQAHDHPGELQ
ncbi:MAG: ankyrin repeat domain-containing protein [Proteobacteria bacterium]|nr:ankyrin repeat domain-containing protein [Pseudomonadota bacterium]